MSRGDAVNQRNRTRVLPKPDCYDYVRLYYRVPAYIGVRVKLRNGREGVLVQGPGRGDQYLHVRFEGETRVSGPYHPTDGIEYLVVRADAQSTDTAAAGSPSEEGVRDGQAR